MSAAMWVKRTLRPLIPDQLMARYRLAQHSRQVRTNVDVVLKDPGEQRRWLGTTPDTYRVVGAPASINTHDPVREIEVFGSDTDRAVRLLDVPDAEVGVVARVAKPAIVDRRRTEPPMEPIAIAAPSEVISEVGGTPTGSEPLAGLLCRLRDAGRRVALEPVVETGPVDPRRHDPIALPPVVILSAVPMHDVGGGSRATQLALELVRRGNHVTYVALYGTQESVDLGLRFVHANLEQVRADVFDPGNLVSRVDTPGLVIVEIPARGYRPPVEVLQAAGWSVIYDVIDDWSDPALGGDWYDESTEVWFAGSADHVTASAADLAVRIEGLGTRAVLIPNAVNTDLFSGASEGGTPGDFPAGDGPVFGYVGSLYGQWFDWDALRRVALAFPDARIVVIGDDKAAHPTMPGNVSFLGLKAQFELPPYVGQFDVGLLPFAVTDTTHAVSPLKVYECLASGVPVAAPPLRALDGLEGVAVNDDLVAAVRQALDADAIDSASVIARHSWSERIAALAALVGLEPTPGSAPVKIVLRPVTHYEKNARLVDPRRTSSPGTP
ncbi:MAG: glycosyltransferase [Actinomycetota bacterium]|nr:glycosyltransferase [Actinomycetota bacterium]